MRRKYMKQQGQNMADLFESLGPEKFCAKFESILEGKDGKPPLKRPDDFSIGELYESVDSTTFVTVIGTLLSKQMIDSYTAAAGVGDSLVTTFKSTQKVDTIPGLDLVGDADDVREGMPYPHAGDVKEKYVTVGYDKKGLSIDVTEETALFDETGKILMLASQIAENVAAKRERAIMYTVQDVTGYKAWYPSNTQVNLYSTSTTAPHRSSNQITNNLQDYTDIDAARLLLAKMTNLNGDPIEILNAGNLVLLVPHELYITAARLLTSSVLVGGANAEGNPLQHVLKGAKPIGSSYLTAQSPTAWYFGNFKKQFVWKEVIPMQVRQQRNTAAQQDRDVIATYNCRYLGKCAARDFLYVIKSLGTN